MAAPKTRNWSANENAHKPKGFHVLVRGEVEVSTLSKLPQLTKRTSRDPKVLELELTIVADPDEPSGDAMVWRCANYHEVVKPNQFSDVVIMWDDNVIKRVPVVDDREFDAHMKQQAQAQNSTAAKTIKLKPAKKAASKKAAAKKAAPKKAAAKKKAPKAVGGWAKKAKKKTGKKAARKSAKKPAKKSALNKFVRKIVKKLTPGKKKKKR
jgi:hypothetical protein